MADDHEDSLSGGLRRRSREFTRDFVQRSAIGIGIVSLLFAGFSFFLPQGATMLVGCIVGILVCSLAYWLAKTEHLRQAAIVFLVGVFASASIALLARVTASTVPTMGLVLMVLIALGAFLLERREFVVLGASSLLIVGAIALLQRELVDEPIVDLITSSLVAVCLISIQAVALDLFVGHSRSNLQALHDYAEDIERVVEQAAMVAAGDLSGDVDGDSRVSQVVRTMLGGLRTMVTEIRRTVGSLAAATREIAAMARQQEQGAVEQASAVHEVQQTLGALARASSTLAHSAGEVHRTAEKTRETNVTIAERTRVLSAHTRRIGELLEVIKGVANKSEILALNASLEGAKAGEAGRGFSLVATQMQRLAESVMDSVADVRMLTHDIRESTHETVVSTEEGTKLAAISSDVAREISAITDRQRSSTEQVTAAMEDISLVARQVSTGSSQTLAAARDLTTLSEELDQLVGSFRLRRAG